MIPIEFPQATKNLKAPPGQEKEVTGLPVYEHPDEHCLISCWQLSPEELAEVQRTGVMWLYVWGPTTYPVSLGGLSPWPETKEKEGKANEKRN